MAPPLPPPRRIFLDTNVVNFTLDHGEAIFEGQEIDERLSEGERENVIALYIFFQAGQRIQWQIAISEKTYNEVMATPCSGRRRELLYWFNELWVYWRDICDDEDNFSNDPEDAIPAGFDLDAALSCFPDASDRELIADAIEFKCDVFLTRDGRTILRRRHKTASLPLEVMSPAELGARLRPWLRLIC
jgi:hypothetical protein